MQFMQGLDTVGVMAVVGFGGYALLSAGVSIYSAMSHRSQRNRFYSSPPADAVHEKNPVDVLIEASKWLHCPITAVSFLYTFAGDKEFYLTKIPAFFSTYGGELQKVMPLHPKSMSEAFQLGQLYEKASNLAPTGEKMVELLQQTANISGRATVKLAELLALPDSIKLADDNRGPVSRILGLFSIVNAIWLVSILGLTVTVGPFLWILARPIRRILVKLWSDVIIPTLIKCRRVFEYVFYAISVYLIVESARYANTDAYSMVGTMTGLTGVCALFLSWAYTTFLNSTGGGNPETWWGLSTAIVGSAAIPVAYLHHSTLIGYVAVAALLQCLGVSGCSSGLCVFIGFDSESQVLRTAGASLWLTLFNASLRALNIKNEWLHPLQPAVGVIGTTVYFLALLIFTFERYWYRNRFSNFVRELIYVSNIAAYYFVGEFLGMPGTVNVARVYGALWAFTKFCEHTPKNSSALIVSTFVGFGILYAMSLQLSRHPEYITALFPALG